MKKNIIILLLVLTCCQSNEKEQKEKVYINNAIILYEQEDPCIKLTWDVFNTQVFKQYESPDFLHEYLDMAIENQQNCKCYHPKSSGFFISHIDLENKVTKIYISAEHSIHIGSYKNRLIENFFIYKNHAFAFIVSDFVIKYNLKKIREVSIAYKKQKGMYDWRYSYGTIELIEDNMNIQIKEIVNCRESK